jgi:hypothetical protein
MECVRTSRRLLAVVVLATLAMVGCTGAGEQEGPVGPVFGEAELVDIARRSDAEPYQPPRGDNMCPTTDVTYESEAEAEEILEFYEDRDFELLGDAGYEDGELVRWIGERGEGPDDWRRVDIYSFGGTTGFILSEADC